MLLVSSAFAAAPLLGYTLGQPPPASAVCVSYGQGLGACGPSVQPFAGLDVVGVQADLCNGVVTSVGATRAATSAEAAYAAADQLRSALADLGWVLPAAPRESGASRTWAADTAEGLKLLVAAGPGLRAGTWAAVARVQMGDGICRSPG